MLSLLMALGVALHPIHTTQASLSVEPGQAYARLVIRAFLEDFPPGRDSALAVRYLEQRLMFSDASGRRLPLALEGLVERSGVLSIEISVRSPVSWEGVLVHDQLLCDRFTDQVNVMQVKRNGGTATLLFTPGTRPQAIR